MAEARGPQPRLTLLPPSFILPREGRAATRDTREGSRCPFPQDCGRALARPASSASPTPASLALGGGGGGGGLDWSPWLYVHPGLGLGGRSSWKRERRWAGTAGSPKDPPPPAPPGPRPLREPGPLTSSVPTRAPPTPGPFTRRPPTGPSSQPSLIYLVARASQARLSPRTWEVEGGKPFIVLTRSSVHVALLHRLRTNRLLFDSVVESSASQSPGLPPTQTDATPPNPPGHTRLHRRPTSNQT